MNKRSGSKWDRPEVVLAIAAARLIFFIVWVGCVGYSTYSLYLATEQYVKRYVPTQKVFGILSPAFGRGRDSTDDEWNIFMTSFVTKNMGWWFLCYVIVSNLVATWPIKIRMGASILMTISLGVKLMGWTSVMVLLQQPIVYCILMNKFRYRAFFWGFTIVALSLLSLDEVLNYIVIGDYDWGFRHHWFMVVVGWNFARCLSYAFDNWDNPQISLWNLYSYCFYFPTVFMGPLVLYYKFERDILLERGRRDTLTNLFKKLIYIAALLLLCEVILHVLPFRHLAVHRVGILSRLNLWVLGGIIFWLGQFFMLKYMVMYGIGTSIANFEGLEMPPLPKCPSHIHRYSVIWKDFDRGLYEFLVKYIYVPSIQFMQAGQFRGLNSEVQKLLASVLTFCYVYIWHGISESIQIWSFFNFLGITVERIGSFLHRKFSAKIKTHELMWDFVLEPLVTVPLAAMSISTSSVFLCNLTVATIFAKRFYNAWHESYTGLILFSFTHVAVSIRTMPSFLPRVKKCLKKMIKSKQ